MRTSSDQTGQWLQELREARGLSPEDVPFEMRRAKIDPRAIPCGRTIRRIEATGRMPAAVRHAFGLAQFYGVDIHQLWPVDGRRLAA